MQKNVINKISIGGETVTPDGTELADLTLESFDFTRQGGKATVEMAPAGAAGLITPWNSDAFFIYNELATALAAG